MRELGPEERLEMINHNTVDKLKIENWRELDVVFWYKLKMGNGARERIERILKTHKIFF